MSDAGRDRIAETLRELGAAVEPPPRAELASMARRATERSEPGARRRRPFRLSGSRGAAAAAALATAVVIVVVAQPGGRSSQPPGAGQAESSLIRFPEGSALQLLLRNAQRKDGTS